MFRIQYGVDGDHPSCVENLARAAASFDIDASLVPNPFNVFMNVKVDESGRLEVQPPRSGPGDSITFRVETDLIVAVAACSATGCSGGRCTGIDLEVRRE